MVIVSDLTLVSVLQVWRWSQQYQVQLTGKALPEMMELIGWLKAHIPADDNDPSVGRISHGDYRCGLLAKYIVQLFRQKTGFGLQSVHTHLEHGARCLHKE